MLLTQSSNGCKGDLDELRCTAAPTWGAKVSRLSVSMPKCQERSFPEPRKCQALSWPHWWALQRRNCGQSVSVNLQGRLIGREVISPPIMNCPSRTDDTLLHDEWNQNPPFLAPDLTTRQDLNGISNTREHKEGSGNSCGPGQSLASLDETGKMSSPSIDPEKNKLWHNGASLTSKSGTTL
jgi:hypothetical protein